MTALASKMRQRQQAMQRALCAGVGRVRATLVLEAVQWTQWTHPSPEGIERYSETASARHQECQCALRDHGWTGTELVCPGDWLVRAPSGGMQVLKPAAFLAQYEAVELEQAL